MAKSLKQLKTERADIVKTMKAVEKRAARETAISNKQLDNLEKRLVAIDELIDNTDIESSKSWWK